MCELERLEDRVLGDLVAAGLDHRQRLARADDDEVERRLLELLERRVEDELVVDAADADGADRAEERQRRDHERRRRPVDAEDVVRRDEIGREDGADDLHLVAEALRPERPDRAVDHPCRERRALGRTAFPLEEAARDLPGGVHLLLDVDRQREEVGVRPRVGASDGGREDHRLARADDDGAVGLLGELARLEDDLLTAHVDGNRGDSPGCDCTHVRYPFTFPLCPEGGGLSQPSRSGGSLKLPPSLFVCRGALSAEAELLDEGAVALDVLSLQVVEEAPPLADELQEPAPRVVVLRVRPQMLGQIVDPSGEKGNLHFCRTCVGRSPTVLLDDFQLDFLGEAHASPPGRRLRNPRPA